MSRTRHWLRCLVLLSCTLVTTIALATPGVVVRKADLRSSTSLSARVLQQLPPGTQVTLVKRRGGWQQITLADDTKGWVRLYQIRAGKASATTVKSSTDESRGVLSNLAAWSRGASGLFGSSTAPSTSETWPFSV